MTTQDDIVFFCVFCSQKIAIQDSRGGFTVECPACLRRIPVPRRQDLGPAHAKHPTTNDAKIITIPKGALLNGSAPRSPSATVTILPPPPESVPPNNDISLFVLGCVCLVLGVLLALLLPHAVFVHTSLFLTALVAALLCIARRLIAPGAALLLATLFVVQLMEVPLVTPLLLQFVPQPAAVQQQAQATGGPATKRLVIDQNGAQVLVPADREEIVEAPDHYRPESETPAPVAPPQEKLAATPAAPEPIEKAPAVEKSEPPVAQEPSREEAPAIQAKITETPAPTPASFTSKPKLPFSVYGDCSVDPPYTPSGWMGYFDAIDLDDCWEENPHSGKTCFRMAYNATYYWGGVAWQSPPNNWGEAQGGYDLSGATELTFWARAERDGTMAEFKVGIHSSARFADTADATTGKKKLSTKWKQFKLPLKDLDLSRVISGFVCVVEGAEIPPIVYLDDIEYR